MRIKQSLFDSSLPANSLAAILAVTLMVAVALMVSGCGEQQGPQDPTGYYGQTQHTEVEDPIGFTEQNYDFTGQTSIAEVLEMVGSGNVWYGLSPLDPFPMGDESGLDVECGGYGNEVAKVEELPATIEGIVTLHPRYFQKVNVCDQDQRFYGSYFIQDESGGILVLNDSRVAHFTFGQRVSLRVRGLVTSFNQPAVIAFDQEEVIGPDEYHDIYFEEIDRAFDASDKSKVRRIEGTVITEPTNANFNGMVIEGDEGAQWSVSIDRDLGNRGVELYEGDRVRLTGPVINSYGLNLLIASLGQIERLDADQ
jgi:hypothetical protein